jgi:O-antigen/teichoic acid export membrane protein
VIAVSQIHRTTQNLVNVIGGELLLRAANALVAVLIGRVYGVAVLGAYAAILAVATLAERVADNGLELTGIAEVSRKPENLSPLATGLYINKAVLSAAAIALLAVIAWILGLSAAHLLIAAVLTIRTFIYSYCRLNAGLLKALNRTKPIVLIQALHFIALTICALAVFLRQQTLLTLLLCLLATQIMEFVLTFMVLSRLGLHRAPVSFSSRWQLVRRSTSIGATYTLSTLMLRGDVVVLSLIASATVVGAFAAANTGLVMIYVVAWLFSGILLSDLGSLSANREACDAHFRKCLKGVVLLTVPMAAVSAVFARPVISTVFGRRFDSAGWPGAVMMLATPFIFANAAFLSRTVARHVSRVSLGIYAFTAVLSLLLNYFLGRWQGAAGVACSILIREAVMTLLFVRLWNLPEPYPSSAFKADAKFATLVNT